MSTPSTVYVEIPKPAARIDLNISEATLTSVGQSLQLNALVFDIDGVAIPSAMVAWSSSHPEVAAVDTTGLVSAVANGTTLVTATSGGVSTFATIHVVIEGTVPPPPLPTAARIEISPPSATLTEMGETLQLTATVYDNNDEVLVGAAVSWTSSNPSIATVDGGGLVTAASNGYTQITVRSGAVSASVSITVSAPEANRPPVAVGMIPALELTEGASPTELDVSGAFRDPDGDDMEYSAESGDESVVTVAVSEAKVTISPILAGTTTVTVIASDGSLTAEQTISAIVLPLVSQEPDLVIESFLVDDNTVTSGQVFRLSATVHNQGDGVSGSSTLRFYRSLDSTVESNDTEVAMDQVASLEESESIVSSVHLTAPTTTGTFFYGGCVDVVPGEADTLNNCSDAVPVTIGTNSPPDKPTNALKRREGSTFVLSWNPSVGATHYNLYYSWFLPRLFFSQVLVTDVTETTYTHTEPAGILLGTDTDPNYYWIEACNNIGCSERHWIGLPINTTIRVVSETQNSLTIEISSHYALYYELYRSDFIHGGFEVVNEGIPSNGENSVRHTDDGLNADDTYYYKVKACNTNGCSGFSEVTQGTTEVSGPVSIPPMPTGLDGE